MIKEKHILTNSYNHHALSRYIDVYEVSANRCHSVPESGYKGTEATLVDEPAWNEKFSSYSITGATLTGNNFIVNNDVTAQANYETAKNVTTVRCNSTKNSGFIGDTASLTNSSPAWNEKFSSYSITGSTLTGSNFKFTGSNITAQANFETAKNVTLQTDGHGSIASTKSSGFINDTATLSNTASNGYGFSGYSITGATLTGSNFKFTGSNITAKAWFSAEPSYTSKAVNSYFMSTGNGVSGSQYRNAAWVSETNPDRYLVVTLPYTTTSRTYNYKPFASDRLYTTLTSNRNYVSNYRTLVIDENNWATGGALNASAVVTSIGVNCEMWWSLPSTATQSCTFNTYASVNNQLIASGGPLTIAPGQTLFTKGWNQVHIPLTNNIIIDKNNSIPIKFYKDSTATAVSAGLSATHVTWNGYISALV